MKFPRTSLNLLSRVSGPEPDPQAWHLFVERYRPTLVAWARRWGAQGASADDVAQLVLVTLVRQLKTFHYDPSRSFRAWLKTITSRMWAQVQRDQIRALGAGAAGLSHLSSIEAREDMMARLQRQTDREALELAMRVVQQRVETRTWEAFRLTAIEGLDGRTVAERLGMSVSSVYVARHSIRERLSEEVRRIQAD
jgi:RNA polymerase sigma factor (sigma-70 family)